MNLVSLHINKKPLDYSLTAFLYSQLKQIIMNTETKVQEIYRPIKDYPNYQVSNLGNIKSLERKVWGGKVWYETKEKVLKPSDNGSGYLMVGLFKNGKKKTGVIHKFVAEAFLNHKPDGTHKLVINHINFIKTDNRVENLEITTQRENANKKHIKSSSQYVGVSWNKQNEKWVSSIYINGKLKYLGYFFNELEASESYKEALELHLK